MPTKTTKRPARRAKGQPAAKSAQPTQPAATEPPPATLHDLLLPLAAAAVQTSVHAYRWGLQRKEMYRAGVIMDICWSLLQELNGLAGHAGLLPVMVVPGHGASSLPAPNGPGPAPSSP